jgi:hypothetical protein
MRRHRTTRLENEASKIGLANSKTKLILSQSSQDSERENRIRQPYQQPDKNQRSAPHVK